jgi:hypothetical protein
MKERCTGNEMHLSASFVQARQATQLKLRKRESVSLMFAIVLRHPLLGLRVLQDGVGDGVRGRRKGRGSCDRKSLCNLCQDAEPEITRRDGRGQGPAQLPRALFSTWSLTGPPEWTAHVPGSGGLLVCCTSSYGSRRNHTLITSLHCIQQPMMRP